MHAFMPDDADTTAAAARLTRRGVAVAFALLVLWSMDAGAATIAVGVRRHGDAVEVEASARLSADLETAWRVLTDYDRYVDFIPDLRVSRVVSRRGGVVDVEQSGYAALWVLRIPLAITFEISEFPPTRLQSRAVGGSLRSLESNYQLTPTADGVRLDYKGLVDSGFALFGTIEERAVEESIARQFQALADAIERRSVTDAATPPAAARPLARESAASGAPQAAH
jgi:hypothetical protein